MTKTPIVVAVVRIEGNEIKLRTFVPAMVVLLVGQSITALLLKGAERNVDEKSTKVKKFWMDLDSQSGPMPEAKIWHDRRRQDS